MRSGRVPIALADADLAHNVYHTYARSVGLISGTGTCTVDAESFIYTDCIACADLDGITHGNLYADSCTRVAVISSMAHCPGVRLYTDAAFGSRSQRTHGVDH